ncbi:MAG: hypothetical protein K0R29_1489 [Pseudobdellovibrio sp.]|jgi:hypothetical protein|nr:hypothetical protein [Pseudobdellovibrio sp.]
MSLNNKKLSLIFSVGLVAVLLYAGGGYVNEKYFSQHQKMLKPLPPQSVFTSKGVSTRLLKVVLEHEKVQTDSETASVTALVSMPFEFNNNLNFKWKLGEGVKIVEGTELGVIQGMRAGQVVEIKIKVNGFSLMQNHHIAFEVNGSLNGRNIHGQALIASDAENTFENIVQNVEHIKASQ